MLETEAIHMDPQRISEVKQAHSLKLTKQHRQYLVTIASSTIFNKMDPEVRDWSEVKKSE